jgi:hypothetical protein
MGVNTLVAVHDVDAMLEVGLHPRTLSALRDSGNPDLVTIALRIPN